jgi:hypothetical protein
LRWALKNGSTSIPSTALQLSRPLKSKGYQIIATLHMRMIACWKILIFRNLVLYFWNRERRIIEEILQRADGFLKSRW